MAVGIGTSGMTRTGLGGGLAGGNRPGMATGLLLATAVGALALPSAVLAFSSRFDALPVQPSVEDDFASFTPAAVDTRLSRTIPVHSLSKGQVFRFTPAGTTTRPDRSVTVAVRVDPQTAREISVRATRPQVVAGGGVTPLRIAPTAYNLGVSRGFQSFAQNLVPPVEVRRIEMPDLRSFSPGKAAPGAPSRFSPRISLDEREMAGSAPRTFAGDGEDTVDVGGSYRVTRNLNVTAGVRYSQERDRLQPLTDGKQDSQAVYVGTQFRF